MKTFYAVLVNPACGGPYIVPILAEDYEQAVQLASQQYKTFLQYVKHD